jgi:hypothetical protein
MPIPLAFGTPTLLVRREAFERAGITRTSIDDALTLTDEEFRVERGLVAIGPIHDPNGVEVLVTAFEAAGLVYFDDFFDLSGNWPEWISLLAMAPPGETERS